MKSVIILVDDEKIVLDSLKTELKQRLTNQKMETAESGMEALELIEELQEEGYQIPLIITDYIMPDIKGDEFLARAHLILPFSLKIMLTGQADLQAVGNAVNKANLYRFISKPWDSQDLVLTVQEALKSYEQTIQLAQKTRELEKLNSELEMRVVERTEELRIVSDQVANLLNNADEGFLSFGADLVIEEVFSRQCLSFFQEQIAGKKFPYLITDQAKEQFFLEEILTDILNGNNPNQTPIFLSLLPAKVTLAEKTLSLKYKLLEQENILKMMVIVSDITEKIHLQNKLEQEHQHLRMILKAINQINDFQDLRQDFKHFLEIDFLEYRNILSSEKALQAIYLRIHTYKGLFAQFEIIPMVNVLHEIETDIGIWMNNAQAEEKIQKFEITILSECWHKVEQTIQNAVGKSLQLNQETKVQQEQRVKGVFDRLTNFLPECYHDLLQEQQMILKLVPIQNLFNMIPGYLEELANRLEKPIYDVIIEGEEILVDPFYYTDFTKSLIHVFRNAVYHGIEDLERRIELHKNELGVIKCNIKQADNFLIITISDDGKGLDPVKIYAKAREMKLISEDRDFDNQEIMQLIFSPGFSTAEEVSTISGRGVGLASVKEELHKLQGEVDIQSVPDQGTTFVFKLPMVQSKYLNSLTAESLLKDFSEKTVKFMSDHYSLSLLSEIPVDSEYQWLDDNIIMFLKGQLNSVLICSLNSELSDYLAKESKIEFEADDFELIKEENIKEIINIIMGNVLVELGEAVQFVHFSIPLLIKSGEFQNPQILDNLVASKLRFKDFVMQIALLRL